MSHLIAPPGGWGVISGGTNTTVFTPYAVVLGPKADNSSLQDVGGVGTSGQVLTSNGAGTIPTWQTISTSVISTSGTSVGPGSSSTQTITHNLGKTPAIIRLTGIGDYSSNMPGMSWGTYNNTGNTCVYIDGGVGANPGISSSFSIRLEKLAATVGVATGVVQNVGSTTFDIVWTLSGGAINDNSTQFMWEAQ